MCEKKFKIKDLEYTIKTYSDDNNSFILMWENDFYKFQKLVKVVDDSEFTYKLYKSYIKASGGASGLFAYMSRCIDNNFMMCLVYKIIDFIINDMKAYLQSIEEVQR